MRREWTRGQARRPRRSLTYPAWGLLLLALAALALVAGCQQQGKERNPLLPPGFAASQVPKAPLNAYIYLNQGQPVPLAPETLGLSKDQAPGLALTRLAVWAGPDTGAFGLQATLTTEEGARLLQGKAAEGSNDLWTHSQGFQLSIVRGEGEWSAGLRQAIESGSQVPFKETYPEAWKSILLLPESPPRPPAAAGVLLVDEALLKALSEAKTPELSRLATALRTSSATGAAFAVYASKPLRLSGEIDAAFARDAQLRVVIVVRTRLVGPLLSGAMNALAGSLRLERVEMGGRTVYRYQEQEVTALLVPQGGVLYVVVAPGGPAAGEDLLAYLDLK
ncbi:MAG: hypothetical protein HY688_00995 [Chloroflexi bacterium]|nr:hypothetical protein [Chloroflexota bacterium]